MGGWFQEKHICFLRDSEKREWNFIANKQNDNYYYISDLDLFKKTSDANEKQNLTIVIIFFFLTLELHTIIHKGSYTKRLSNRQGCEGFSWDVAPFLLNYSLI